ncbi:hypothetical protein GCM10010377_24100 [Streptomyces viridiviolaceus]|nr:hypothetical protein GCM10010377_24100 [Streptomyces viridiviolaceus]
MGTLWWRPLGALVLLLFVHLDPAFDDGLAALRPLGGFFVLPPPGPPPRRLPTLSRVYGDRAPDVHDDPLGFLVRKVEAALRAPEPRIAASVAHQGLAARLWSVTLGCAAVYGAVPDLDPRLLHWDPDGSAPGDLWLAEARARPADAGTVADTVLHAHLVPLTASLRARYRVAAGLLWGNAASALAGAARELDRRPDRHGGTEAAARVRALTADLLAHPMLARAGTLTGTAFRRRSCCLYYRVPGGGVCGDCCFRRPPRFPTPPRSSPRAPSG